MFKLSLIFSLYNTLIYILNFISLTASSFDDALNAPMKHHPFIHSTELAGSSLCVIRGVTGIVDISINLLPTRSSHSLPGVTRWWYGLWWPSLLPPSSPVTGKADSHSSPAPSSTRRPCRRGLSQSAHFFLQCCRSQNTEESGSWFIPPAQTWQAMCLLFASASWFNTSNLDSLNTYVRFTVNKRWWNHPCLWIYKANGLVRDPGWLNNYECDVDKCQVSLT